MGGRTMRRLDLIVVAIIGLVLLFHTLTAPAQVIEPTLEHYMTAADAIAVERAAERLVLAEQAWALAAEMAAREQRARLADEAYRSAIVDAWAAVIQRAHGQRPFPRPGTGWHEVNR